MKRTLLLWSTWGPLFLLILGCASALPAEEDRAPGQASAIIKEMMRGCGQWVRDPGTLKERSRLVGQLSACGEPAIPAVLDSMRKSGYSPFSDALIDALVDMPNSSGAKALRSLYESKDKGLQTKIAIGLGNHVLCSGAGVSPLPPECVAILQDQILSGEVLCVARAVEALRCLPGVDGATTARSLAKRLIEEVEKPSPQQVPAHSMMPLPEREQLIGRIVASFRYVRTTAPPVLREERSKAKDEQITRWLDAALGICGDSEVAPRLEAMVRDEKNPYARAAMIPAYAAAAGEKALPLLRTLEGSEEQLETREGPRPSPVRDAARQAIRDVSAGPHGFDPPLLPLK